MTLKRVERDLRSLMAYDAPLTAEIACLHEATLELINLEENRLLTVFSIAALLFLPPTMIGIVNGMISAARHQRPERDHAGSRSGGPSPKRFVRS